MQVSPCGHQSLCRLCFVQNIKEAVSNRNLPLRCLICNAKIARVKNNRTLNGPEHPVHVRGQTTNILRQAGDRRMLPMSVSGYSLCATSDLDNSSGIAASASSYSVSSALSSMSSSSVDSQRSIKSTTSVQSNKSVGSNNSWFSIGSFSSFQAGGFVDSRTISRTPRVRSIAFHLLPFNTTLLQAHSLSSRGKLRGKLTSSSSSNSIKSFTNENKPSLYRDAAISKSESLKLSAGGGKSVKPLQMKSSMSLNDVPLSPNSIDERIRAIQGAKKPSDPPLVDLEGSNNLMTNQSQVAKPARDTFRRTNNGLNLNIDNCLKGQIRR